METSEPYPVGSRTSGPCGQCGVFEESALWRLYLLELCCLEQACLGSAPKVIGRTPLLNSQQVGPDIGRPDAAVEERMSAPVAVLLRFGKSSTHELHQLAVTGRIVAGAGCVALAVVVRFVLEFATVAAEKKLAQNESGSGCAHDSIARRSRRVVPPSWRYVPVTVVVRGEDHAGQHRLAQDIEKRCPALHAHAVVHDDVTDLVTQ